MRRNSIGLFAALMAMSMDGTSIYQDETRGDGKPSTNCKRYGHSKQGQKEFTINGVTVMAATKKAAIKKVNKIINS